MTTKMIKLQIIKPMDMKWKDFGQTLRDIQYFSWKVKNKTVQYAWEWDNYSFVQKELNGVYPKPKEIIGKSVESYIYHDSKDFFNRYSADILSTTIQVANNHFKELKQKINTGEISVPSFKRKGAIELRNKNINLYEDGEQINADLSLLSRDYAKELGRKTGRIPVALAAKDKSKRAILRRMLNGEYKQGAGKITQDKNGKWYLHIAYTFEPAEAKAPRTGGVMGVDFGVSKVAYMAINDSYQRDSIDGGEIAEQRRRIEGRRNSKLMAAKHAGDGRRGHGRATRIALIEAERDKVANFRDNKNHHYANYILDFADKHNVERIHLEDLKGISEGSRFLSGWTYFDLATKIEYKARERGIEVVKVEPKYTSQRCSHCGVIDRDSRKSQELFECTTCGTRLNADYNAAKNLALPDIEDVMREQAKVQKLSYPAKKANKAKKTKEAV